MNRRTLQNRRILISGASVAGPSLAWWLARHGFRPTVVERAPQLRGGGYAVDFRGAAHLSVLAKMGILDRIRERQTHLSATTYVDADGRRVASMPPGIFGGDVEILRGLPAGQEPDQVPVHQDRDRHQAARVSVAALAAPRV